MKLSQLFKELVIELTGEENFSEVAFKEANAFTPDVNIIDVPDDQVEHYKDMLRPKAIELLKRTPEECRKDVIKHVTNN